MKRTFPGSSAFFVVVFTALMVLCPSVSTPAQNPGLAWSTNLNARVFSVDASTNVYAYTPNSAVLVFNAAGALVQSNKICPLPGRFGRDSSGNYLVFGTFDGTQDFGGITLVGGWTNHVIFGHPSWLGGYPSCFLAQYSSGGALQWVTAWGGPQNETSAVASAAYDMAVNPDGSVTVSYAVINSSYGNYIALFDASGSKLWAAGAGGQGSPYPGAWASVSSMIGGVGGYLNFPPDQNEMIPYTYTSAGVVARADNLTFLFAKYNDSWVYNGKPVINANGYYYAGNLLDADLGVWTNVLDTTFGSAVAVTKPVGTNEVWLVAGDNSGNVYLADTTGALCQYNAGGALVWSNNFGQPVIAMQVDSLNNRFLSFSGGSIAALQSDHPAVLPVISTGPQPLTLFSGDSTILSVSATGTAPLQYAWQLNGTNLLNATNATLTLNNALSAQSGSYACVVSNAAGAVTSTPALLRVKNVELYVGSQMLTNGSYYFATTPTITIRSAYASGEQFYTLNGTTPSFGSTPYAGPFGLSNSATVTAIGYSSDFSQSELADVATITVPAQFTLTATTPGGGAISLNPPGGIYASNTTVAVTATPAAGWTFLNWQGAGSSSSTTINLTLNQSQTLTGIFATTLSTTVIGGGQVTLNPAGGTYAYGTVVRLEGIPSSGGYFGAWGNAASGNVNPLYFTVTNANPVISSAFGTVGSGQAALTVLVSGKGRIGVNPAGNVFATGQQVTITATPDAGQSFLGWSGGASGTQNPLTMTLNQNTVITAGFSGGSSTLAPLTGGYTAGGFRFAIISDPGAILGIFGSSNLVNWQLLGSVTNSTGLTYFTDTNIAGFRNRFYRAE